MKKSFLALASFAAIAVGCQVEKMTDELPLVDEAVVYEAVTEAYTPATKTAMDGENKVVWSAGDNIAVFQTMSPAKFVVTSESAGKTAAKFTLLTAAEEGYDAIDANVAVYPYSSEVYVVPEMDTDENYDMVPTGLYKLQGYEIPSTQTYAPNSFGNGAFPMVALNENVEERTFEFKNILGAVKLQLTGTKTVKSIKLEGNSGEYLSGMVQNITFAADEDPVVQWNMYEPGVSHVTLDCGEGVELNSTTATNFVLAVPPTVFESGFTVTVFDTDGGSYKIKTNKENEVRRSGVLVMPVKNIDEGALGVSLKYTASLTDATLKIDVGREDVEGFYGIFVSAENWMYMKSYFDQGMMTLTKVLQGAMGTEMPARFYNKEFTGKLSEFGLSDDYIGYGMLNMTQPNSSYYAIVVPANELPVAGGGEDDELGGIAPLNLDEDGNSESGEAYTLDDAIFFEVRTNDFSYGGSVALPDYTIEEGYKGSLVTFEPSEDVAYMMYEIFEADALLPTESNYIEKLTYDAYYSPLSGTEVEVNNSYGVLPGTEYVLCVLVADDLGKTSFHTIDVATKPVPYKNDFNVTVATEGEYAAEFEVVDGVPTVAASVTSWPDDAVKLYYTINKAASYPSGYSEDNVIAEVLEGTSTTFTQEITLSEVSGDVVDLSVKVQQVSYMEYKYYAHVFAVDATGNVSHIATSNMVTVPKSTN